MLLHSIIPLLKAAYTGRLGIGSLLLAWTSPFFAMLAVSEAFLGQLLNSLISAVPPLIAIWFLARNQNRERAAGNKEILEGQKVVATEVAKAVDGQLSKYVEAKEELGHRAGVEHERKEQRAREGEAAIAQQANPTVPAPVTVENTPEKPANVKPVN